MALLAGAARRARAAGLIAAAASPARVLLPRLRSSRAGLLSAVEPTIVSPPFRPIDTRKGVSVVGAGRMGRIRTEGVMSNPGTFLASVVDPDEEKARALAKLASVPAFW